MLDLDEDTAVHLRGLNPSQIEAVTQPHQAVTRVVAGPGAGKTRVLTCRIAHLLRTDNNPSSRILAVTFTKKAAGEMKHRLEALLRQQGEIDDVIGSYGSHGARVNTDEDEDLIMQEEAPMVPSANGEPARAAPPLMDRVILGTFHSVCAKILRWNGKELSSLPSISLGTSDGSRNAGAAAVLDGSFAIVDQSEQIRIIKEVLKQCDIDLKGSGGGGGKADIRPLTVLNAVCQIKSEDMTKSIDSSSNLLTRNGKEMESTSSGSSKMSKKVRSIAEAIYPKYRRALLTNNSLDFDDLILLTRELLLIKPEVRHNLHRRWKHILVDEFQDTSKVQLDLIKLLTTRSLLVVGDGDQSIYSWRGAHAESMADFVTEFDGHCVSTSTGRDGAKSDSGTMEDKDHTKVNTVFLMENYRSTTNIVKAAQKVISDPSSNNVKSSKERQDMKPMRGKGPSPRVLACADAEAEASFVVKNILEMVDDGDLTPNSTIAIIYRTNAQSRALEEECVAQNLKYLVRGSAGTFYSRAEVKDCLCFLRCIYNSRDRSAMIRALKTPSRGIGDVAIKEFFAYCDGIDKFFADNYPNEPRSRTTPLQVLFSLADSSAGRTFPPASDYMSTRALNRFVPFSSQMKTIYAKSSSETVSGLLSSIMDGLDLWAHFDAISKTTEELSDRKSNVMELLNAAERYDNDGPALPSDDGEAGGESPLGQFLDDVALLTESESDADDTASTTADKRVVVNLMTIHASKGMEFDAVHIVGNEDGTFPTQRAISEGEGSVELDEERRLCYVAMTRAKTHLVLTWRREVMAFFGQGFKVIDCDRSRFLDRLVSKGSSAKKKKSMLKDSAAPSGSLAERRRNLSATQGGRAKNRKMSTRGGSKDSIARSTSSRRVASSTTRAQSSSPRDSAWKDWSPKPSAPSTRSSARDARRERLPMSQSSRQRQNSRPTRTTPTRTSAPLGRNPPRSGQAQRIRLQGNPSKRAEPPKTDSTLFFPVGSSVVHKVHGAGKVLPPPESSSDDDSMLVRIKFESGIEIDLPVGAGLRHKF
eukprot:CAMPEP_0178504834 /NCGR_PEP_ID=MMETSP0696-20121128/18800_1 /TAXON_ID=265572 /ORGANISM="Extubocellulus spinifer, Strain CCMP396" /LENGTH=1039 /DNA_ID=CAMNT_0020134087 /DNA_START=488 /DNA_END=3607 /DNA_ORIENTATION=-